MKPVISQVSSVVSTQTNPQQEQDKKLLAAQWVRDMRFSPDVNKATVGVQSDRVTPQLLLKTSGALLRISRQQEQPSAKDSLAYQKFYGPAEYFAEHIQRDAGGLARGLLWKATNRGNLDFMQPGALDPHVASVFYDSNLSQYIDGSTPFQALDATYKTTRVGEGGIAGQDNAPDQMRVVQPSYFGYVDPVRCYSSDTQLMTARGWKNIADVTDKDSLACIENGSLTYENPTACYKYAFNGDMYSYTDQDLSFLVTANHRMFIRDTVNASKLSAYRTCLAQDLPERCYLLTALAPGNAFSQHTILPGSGRKLRAYKGFVYCVTVPGGLVFCRRCGKQGFWCHNSPERGGVGLASFLTKNVLKGSDGKLYQTFINAHTGNPQLVDSVTAAQSVVTTADALKDNTKSVFALGGKTGVRVVDRSAVDYYLPFPDDSYSIGSNLVPMFSGVKQMRLLMGCFHPSTPVLYYDKKGDVHITQARYVTMKDCPAMVSCDKHGNTKLLPVKKVVTRLAATNKPFYKVVTSSGRSLITSGAHRWVVIQDGKQRYITADKLRKGMIIPRSLFKYVPSTAADVLGVPLTKQIAVLLGRIQRNGKINARGRLSFQLPEQLYADVSDALKQLNVPAYVCAKKNNKIRLSVSDSKMLSWVNDNIGGVAHLKKVPSCILTASIPFVTAYLGSYAKQVDNVGVDDNDDVWLTGLQNELLRAAMSFLLARIFTDTQYRNVEQNGKQMLALKLVSMQFSYGMATTDTITHIVKVKSPGYMIDFDVDDDIYAAACGIITHNSKYASQAIPLVERQVPLVQSLDRDTGKSMQQLVGKKLGTRWAPKSGVVTAVRRDRIDLSYSDGTKGSVSLYKNFPSNIKGFLDNRVLVKAGQKVDKNQLLAASNFTDDNGVQAMGRNLRVGYISYKGGTYQDAVILSQSAAKKMTSRTMYKNTIDLDKTIRTGKKLYSTWKPQAYDKDMLAKLDDDGVARPGTVLQKGDPIVLAVQVTQPSPGTLRRRIITDKSEFWNHTYPGVVTDVTKTRKGIKVYTTVDAPVQIGDKITGRFGNKGTIAQILPDDEMPRDSKDRPLELLMSPLGIVSRTNSSQLVQTLLGKIAEKTGKPIKVPQFSQQDLIAFATKLAKQNNVPVRQTCVDPASGRKLKDILTGRQYIYKLKHMAQSKLSARGTATYNSEGIPASGGQEGSKRFGSMQAIALIGHNAFDTLVKDAKLIRGQSNADFWRQIRTGQVPVIPGEPLVHKKFFAHLQGSGIRVRKTPQGISIFALTNKDVNDLAGPREVKTRDTYSAKTMRPMDGGLFGTDVFGIDGNNWGYIKLQEPVLNPVMQQPVAQILRIPQARLQAILQGRQQYDGDTGPLAIKKALQKINVQSQTSAALNDLKTATNSVKDKALKRYVALQRVHRAGVRPQQFMLDKIPVIPPAFRPITTSNGLTMVADSNYLYAQLLDARDDFKDAKSLPPEYLQKARQQIYNKFKELVGLYDPQSKKLQAKSVHGLLKWALGDQPKASAYQRKVFGSIVDTVGRGVVVPSSRLKLNEIGLPQQMAWGVFAPFITRNLVRAGYNVTQAMRMVKDRKPIARDFLVKTMQHRPVMMNRAPSLHKLSIMGFMPKLVPGHAVQVNPSIVTPFGMDFDGNCCDFDSEIFLKLSKSAVEKFRDRVFIIGNQQQEVPIMTDKNALVCMKSGEPDGSVYAVCKIGEFPRTGLPVKDKNGADVYTCPDGVFVVTCDPVTGAITYKQVSHFTEEHDCSSVKVEFGSRDVIVSDNESMACFDQRSGSLIKVAPKDLGDRLVPVLKQSPLPFGTFGDRDLGWLLGAYISDGWCTKHTVGYSKQEKRKRDEFVRIMRKYHDNFTVHEYADASRGSKSKLGGSVKLHLNSVTLVDWFAPFAKACISETEKQPGERTALKKTIRTELIQHGSEDFLYGLLSGLLDGDGSVVKNMHTGKARFTFRLATSSSFLVAALKNLSYRLGIRFSVTVSPPRGFSSEAYTFVFSTIDIHSALDKLTCVGEHECAVLAEFRAATVGMDKHDVIPVSDDEWACVKDVVYAAEKTGGVYSACSKKNCTRKCARETLLRYNTAIKELCPSLYSRLCNYNTIWTAATAVDDAGKRDVFDLNVADTKVFAVNQGIIIWDTANFHVPVSEAAVRQVKQRMFPERNLIAMKDRRILYRPQKEYIQGLYIATRMNTKKQPRRFRTLAQARQAYRADTLDVDDPIIISEP